MPIVHVDGTKGLHQKSGNGFVGTPSDLQTIGAAGQIKIDSLVVRVDAGGGARNECTLAAGSNAGQIAVIINEGAEAIAFNAAATSKLAGAAAETNNTLAAGAAMMVVWDSTNSLWVPLNAFAVLGNTAS
mgnify:CR=1 FL=1